MNKKMILRIIIILSLELGIHGCIVLPETVTAQVDLSGNPSNAYPRTLDLALQFLLSINGSLECYFSEKSEKKYLVLTPVGLIISVVTLVYNV